MVAICEFSLCRDRNNVGTLVNFLALSQNEHTQLHLFGHHDQALIVYNYSTKSKLYGFPHDYNFISTSVTLYTAYNIILPPETADNDIIHSCPIVALQYPLQSLCFNWTLLKSQDVAIPTNHFPVTSIVATSFTHRYAVYYRLHYWHI